MKILTMANIDALVTLLKAFYLLSHLELRAEAWVASENVHNFRCFRDFQVVVVEG